MSVLQKSCSWPNVDRKLPHNFVAILLEWFSKCSPSVRWGNEFSDCFQIAAGVKQGGVLSRSLLAASIEGYKKLDIAVIYLYGELSGCLLFFDDIMIISHFVSALQHMLQICRA